MDAKDFAGQIESLAALDEPLRRKLYRYVVTRGRDVGRDEAARATRISRALAAFHLDRLVKAGLLEVTYRRLTGRAGPGAGRPAKLYRRSAARIELSLPQRRYELAAHILAGALADREAASAPEALRNAAHATGRRMAQESAGGRGRPLDRATRALEACGFEPERSEDGEIVLRNCPFESLSGAQRDLICGMNLALIQGLIDGLDVDQVRARPTPRAGMCCVALREESHDV